MGLIDAGLFKSLSDRIAEQARQLDDAWTAVTSSGINRYVRVHTSVDADTGDVDVENDIIPTAKTLDADTDTNDLFREKFTNTINADTTHVTGQGKTDLDDYLADEAINVNEHYDNVYNAIKGSHLNAVNVFKNEALQLGKVNFTSSGVGTFTDGSALGTGSGKASSTNFAMQAITAVPTTDVGATNAATLRIIGTGDAGAARSIEINIPAGTTSGTRNDLSLVDTNEFYTDVTNVTVGGGNAGDEFKIFSIVERPIGL